MKNKRFLFLIAIALVILCALTSCATLGAPTIIGQWEDQWEGGAEVYIFSSDGQYFNGVFFDGNCDRWEIGTWEITEDDLLALTDQDGYTSYYEYALERTTLTMDGDITSPLKRTSKKASIKQDAKSLEGEWKDSEGIRLIFSDKGSVVVWGWHRHIGDYSVSDGHVNFETYSHKSEFAVVNGNLYLHDIPGMLDFENYTKEKDKAVENTTRSGLLGNWLMSETDGDYLYNIYTFEGSGRYAIYHTNEMAYSGLYDSGKFTVNGKEIYLDSEMRYDNTIVFRRINDGIFMIL